MDNDDLLLYMEMNLEDDFLLHKLLTRTTPRYRDEQYGRFKLDNFSPEECKECFRFEKEDIITLAAALGLPREITGGSGYVVSAVEGLCICLRRLAYPNRLCDLERIFGLSGPYLSVISNVTMKIIEENKGHLLTNLNNLSWLNRNRLEYYAQSIAAKGAPVQNCWAFIDGTTRPICRPTVSQEEYFSGHKRYHCVKYQSVVCPDGITVSLDGPYPGRRHDAGIFGESGLYDQLQNVTSFEDINYVLYGDCAYPMMDLILKPYSRIGASPEEEMFNYYMSTVRQAVEWSFGQVVTYFAFLDFKKNQKLLLQDITSMYKVATILNNCHTCLYGNLTCDYFNTKPPTLHQYLLDA